MKHKILMLGWEYPPAINGGLGVATYGLVHGLSSHVDIRLILPKASELPTDLVPPNVQTIALTEQSIPRLVRGQLSPRLQFLPQVEKQYVHTFLNPYSTPQIEEFDVETERLKIIESLENYPKETSQFDIETIYGDDLMQDIFKYSRLALRLAQQQDFDLIHVHDWMTFLAGMELKQLTKKPLIVHVHSLEYDRVGKENPGLAYQIEQQAMREADMIIAVSEYTAKRIHQEYGISKAKIRVVHNGLLPVEHKKGKKHFPEKLVVFAGRLSPQKAPFTFLDIATSLLEAEHPLRFAIAGQGELERELVESIARRHLGNRVHALGFLEQDALFELLSAADVVVCPSLSEPFGLVALEAAYCKTPVVLTHQSGSKEVLTEALIADHWDQEMLKEHILAYLFEPSHAKKAVKANFAALDMGWEKAGEKVLGCYGEVMKKSQAK